MFKHAFSMVPTENTIVTLHEEKLPLSVIAGNTRDAARLILALSSLMDQLSLKYGVAPRIRRTLERYTPCGTPWNFPQKRTPICSRFARSSTLLLAPMDGCQHFSGTFDFFSDARAWFSSFKPCPQCLKHVFFSSFLLGVFLLSFIENLRNIFVSSNNYFAF